MGECRHFPAEMTALPLRRTPRGRSSSSSTSSTSSTPSSPPDTLKTLEQPGQRIFLSRGISLQLQSFVAGGTDGGDAHVATFEITARMKELRTAGDISVLVVAIEISDFKFQMS